MTTHSVSSHDNHEPHWPNEPFLGWLKTQTSLYIGQIITLAAFPSTIFGLYYYSSHTTEDIEHRVHITPELLQKSIIWLHIPFLLLFIIKIVSILDKNEIGAYRSNMVYKRIFKERMDTKKIKSHLSVSQEIVRKFKLFFLFFLGSSFLLYIVFAINNYSDVDFGSSLRATSNRFEALSQIQSRFWPFFMNNLGLLFAFWCFTLLYLPPLDEDNKRRQKLSLRISTFVVLAFTLSFPFLILTGINNSEYTADYLLGYITFYNAVSGVLFAVSLCLLIGRLDSKLIGLPSILTSVLYIYASVQPLFVVFEMDADVNKILHTGVLIIVFAFKIYFFFIIVYIFQTGRLLNYFFCFPTLNKLVDSIFQNQFEIVIIKEHSHKFLFAIHEHEKIVYTSDKLFERRKDCLDFTKHLRKIMKNEKSFQIKKSDGTYWVEVVDSEKNMVYCNSHNLKSREEADAMLISSRERIPYCKLNYT